MKKLSVTQRKDGVFECQLIWDDLFQVCGRGASVLEAVGSYVIHSATISIECDPPAILREYFINNEYGDLEFKPPDERD